MPGCVCCRMRREWTKGQEWSGVAMGSTCGGTGRERRQRVTVQPVQRQRSVVEWRQPSINMQRTCPCIPLPCWLVTAAVPSRSRRRRARARPSRRRESTVVAGTAAAATVRSRVRRRMSLQEWHGASPQPLFPPFHRPRHSNGQTKTEPLQPNPNGQALWLRGIGLEENAIARASHDATEGKKHFRRI